MTMQNLKKNQQDIHEKIYNDRNSKPQHRLGTVSKNITEVGVGEWEGKLKSILRGQNLRPQFCRGKHKTFVQPAGRVSNSSVQHLREHFLKHFYSRLTLPFMANRFAIYRI